MLKINEIAKALKKRNHINNNTKIKNIVIDSRKVKKGDLFLAIKGESYDGHNYIKQAVKNGAVCVVSKKQVPDVKAPFFKVKDTVKAIGDIANFHRLKFDIPIICITGSAGKTSTKELLTYILKQKYHVLKTKGNKNNLIGVPLTLLKLNKKHELAVIEIGTSMFGEIRRLTEIVNPQIGVITNIGEAHLEGLKDKKNVLKEKRALLDGLSKDGIAFLNQNDPMLSNIKIKAMKVLYTDIAQSIGQMCGFTKKEVQNLLNKYQNPLKNRFCILKKKYYTIIDDTYNSNPVSFRFSVDKLSCMKNKKNRVIICSDMLQLGKKSKNLHYQVGKYIHFKKIDRVIAVGKEVLNIIKGAKDSGMFKNKLFYFEDKISLKRGLSNILAKGDIILVKGSRAMGMESIVKYICNM